MKPYYQDDLVTLYQGDSLQLLPELSITADVLLTDPPYFKVKEDEWDNQWAKAHEFLSWLGGFLDAAKPLLAPHASVWVFASPAMTSSVERLVGERFRVLNSVRWVKEQGWHQKAEVAALRSYLTPWEGVIFAEQKADEWASRDYESRKSVFVAVGRHLSEARASAGLTRTDVAPHLLGLYRNLDTAKAMLSDWEIGKSYVSPEAHAIMQSLYGSNLRDHGQILREYEDLRREYEDLRRPFNLTERANTTDVWNFPTVAPYPGKHPCEKPGSMLRHMIEASSKPGQIILDPFAGSGSTLEAAKHLGRRAVGIEKDAGYCRAISYRLSQDVLDFGESA